LPALLCSCAGSRERARRVEELEARVAALETRLAELPADEASLASAELDELLARLDSGNALTRYGSVRALASQGESVHAALLETARSGTSRQREGASAVLASTATPDLLGDLLALHAETSSAGTRALLAAALARTKRPEAVDALVKDLDDESRRVRAGAIEGLRDMKDPRAAMPLLRASLRPDTITASLARDAFVSLGENVVLFVAGEWDRLDPRERQDAVALLGEVPGSRVDEHLQRVLRDASPLVGLAAAMQLARRGSPAGRGVALQRLGSDDPVVARAAREVLDALGEAPPPP
jgi:HEAT repeat protein